MKLIKTDQNWANWVDQQETLIKKMSKTIEHFKNDQFDECRFDECGESLKVLFV